MSATPDSSLANLEQRIADLERQLAERTAERNEALEQQNATAEVLGVINSSPGDLAPVFDAILERAMRLCDASFGDFTIFNGKWLSVVAQRGLPPEYAEVVREPMLPVPGGGAARIFGGEAIVQVADLKEAEAYRSGSRGSVALVDIGGARTTIFVALRKEEALLGCFCIFRQEVRPFTDQQIALLQSFAAQAVIAMENARLINETREALEQQTATAEVLEVINASPGNLAPVFDSILKKATDLCGAAFGLLFTWDGECIQPVAWRGISPELLAVMREPSRPQPGTLSWHFVRGENVVCNADLLETESYRKG